MWYYPKGVANILSQFRMIAYSRWMITFDTSKYNKSGNIEDLSYNVTTQEGVKYKFSPMPQELHVHRIGIKQDKNIFGNKSANNMTIFGGSYHTLVENDNEPIREVIGVISIIGTNEELSEDAEEDNPKENSEITGVKHSNKNVQFKDVIYIVTKSRDRFSKRDKLRADRVRRLQHVASFPLDETLKYSVMTNGIKNNQIMVRDIEMCIDMLDKSRYIT